MSISNRIKSSVLLRALGAVLCGAMVGLGFAPTSWWLVAIIGLSGQICLLRSLRWRRAAGLGYCFGLGLCGTAISWLTGLGWWIAALLCAVMALFFLVQGIALTIVSRLTHWPLWTALVWVATEWISCRFPFGGFGWLRLGFTAVDSPLMGLYRILGVTGVSLVLALWAALLAWCYLQRSLWSVCPWGIAIVILPLALSSVGWLTRPVFDPVSTDLITVGVIQGNITGGDPRDPLGRARSVTQNHVAETRRLLAKVAEGKIPAPDFILWPENSTDIDPFQDSQTRELVNSARSAAGVPILVGAVLSGPGTDERQTAGLWWQDVDQVPLRYVKRNLVPFGEYIPGRTMLLPHFPILKLVGDQSIPGTTPGALPIELSDGRKQVLGDVICFELAWDSTVFDTVRNGAQFLTVQSNNASYGGTPQVPQQWQMTRARALETGRDIAVATTDSLSGIIRADGSVAAKSHEFEAWSTTEKVSLRASRTPAIILAEPLGLLVTIVAGGAIIVALWKSRPSY
ncbi:MAG: apolipoprotein N-acyltransferase [Propionibacteriaceae bacterium]